MPVRTTHPDTRTDPIPDRAGEPGRSTGTPINRLLGVLIIGSMMAVLDTTIVNVALRSLSEAFAAPLATIQWATTAYTLALAAVIPTAAWAMARIGAKRTYLTALALFTLGSVLAALAWSAPSLIAFRALQGLGGGLLMPVGMAMVMRTAEPARLGRAMAMLGVPILIGPVAGPALGGWLLDTASWRWIFLVNLPIGIAALALAGKLLRTDAPTANSDTTSGRPTPAKLDVPGLLTLSPGLALLLFGLAHGAELGEITLLGSGAPTLAGLLLIGLFVRRALTTAAPLLDLGLLRDRTFAAAIGTLALFTFGYFGSMLLAPVYWQQTRGLGSTAAGLLVAPVGLVVGTAMQIASRRVDKLSPRRLIATGIAIAALGMALTGLATGVKDAPAWWVVAASMTMGVGAGMVMMPTMTTASRELARARAGAASTALAINSQIGASVGTALVSVLLGNLGTGPQGFRTVYLVTAGVLALALLPALRLPRTSR
ncbi:DHA2 family efflux MFS transporter permease subunit (plasmid) [Streptomyces sp. BI20]|uniref:DHA2 family efflux MFS transporter permease subunit n=1 Tax=Streptomyces sp. BI20 TaxID=3403460 RepID=UPI003C731FC6